MANKISIIACLGCILFAACCVQMCVKSLCAPLSIEYADEGEEEVDEAQTLSRCEIEGKQVRFVVKGSGLIEASQWRGEAWPKCSPQRAKTLALEWIKRNLPEYNVKGFMWECNEVRLQHYVGDTWWWVVEFDYTVTGGGTSGTWPRFTVAVLLNGTIPEAIVEAIPGKKDAEE